jgi:hypothetical protein
MRCSGFAAGFAALAQHRLIGAKSGLWSEERAMPHAPTAAWFDRFTMRLSRLMPSVTVDEAADIALAIFPAHQGIGPEDAADFYVLEAGAVGRATMSVDAPILPSRTLS